MHQKYNEKYMEKVYVNLSTITSTSSKNLEMEMISLISLMSENEQTIMVNQYLESTIRWWCQSHLEKNISFFWC